MEQSDHARLGAAPTVKELLRTPLEPAHRAPPNSQPEPHGKWPLAGWLAVSWLWDVPKRELLPKTRPPAGGGSPC